jgi:outer membrane protein assembly factor BamA
MSTYLKIIVPVFIVLLFSSCKSWDLHTFPITYIKSFPKDTPFVYKTNINLLGNLSKKEKDNLQSGLKVQLEDSVNPKTSEKILWKVLKKPPVFDTSYVQSSRKFMLTMLHASGYFKADVNYDTSVKRKGEAYKLNLNFNVTPGPLWHFDSVWYSIQQIELQRLTDSTLRSDSGRKRVVDTVSLGLRQPFQHIADSTTTEAFLRKGSSFSQDTIAMELDRLAELYRNNGYMRFTRNELVAVWDTLDVSMLKPMVDPLEEIQLLDKLAKEKQNPAASLEIKLRPGYDSTRLVRYYLGHVYILPDYGYDSTLKKDTVVLDDSYTVIYHQRLFKPKILPQNIYLRHGQLYSQNRYLRTIDRFNSNVAWRFVGVDQKIRPGTDTVDYYIKLITSLKYLFTANIEGSQNNNTSPLIAGNLLGIGVNVSLQNRNFAKVAAQTNTTVRYGTELSISRNQKFVSSKEASIGYNIVFPKIIPHLDFLPEKFRTARSILAFNLSNTQRVVLYNLTSYNTSWGYEWQHRNKIWAVKFPNIEYSLLNARDTLKTIFQQNPGLKNLFNDGLVVSGIGSVTINWGTKRNLNTLRANFEESGILTSMINSDFIQKNLYRFIKTNVEYIRIMKVSKNDFVVRLFAGIGVPFKIDTGNGFRSEYLPFFKAYSAGGPNSMRGWGLRRLGPGHALDSVKQFPDRFGDMQFEFNQEYRFYLFKLFGFKVNGAFFTDVGNVWFLHRSPDFPGGEFTFKYFLKDLGIDVGTGMRVDLGFFLIRLDYALKVHNPTPEPVNKEEQDHYFYKWNLKTLVGGVLQFGVTVPFL